MKPRSDIERDIRLHERTLARMKVKSGFHRENVEASLRRSKDKLKTVIEGKQHEG